MRYLLILLTIILLCSCGKVKHPYNGYIDADLVYLSSNFPGLLEHLNVSRGQSVEKCQLLFQLEQNSENFAVEISEFTQNSLLSQRKEILDKMHYNLINYNRTVNMRKQDVASQNDLDVARQNLDVLKNQLADIDFQLKSSRVDTANKKWQVRRKESTAPDEGIIFDTYFTQGEYVEGGQPVLSLLTRKHIKIVFFVPEKDLSQLMLQKKVTVFFDGNAKPLTGVIRYISNIAQYTPPNIYSREERSDLVFRAEASIDNPDLTKTHLGQPVSLELVP